ncbi:hypothetical protein BUALT_Bualt03G0020000 [Buddleja alternifolia]|uniref:Nitrate regulatory gene2 protein-like n=1 Tax=Buddleja alternifolia TaxID=168488 RepID=A0AAV6Y1B8_9LAMI|nr:hypothetical protein BUALT_Bualt03G0020000 [Buddleja alternifolia]
MGCVASRIDKQERVRVCKERKRLMKQLLGYRKEFADSQLAYLRSLKNTGVTLRQFTESESLEIEDNTSGFGFPPSPPPPLPPSPPPPPTFSPDLRKFEGNKPPQAQSPVEEIIEIDEDSGHTPPPPLPTSSWEYWDPFGSPPPQCGKSSETFGHVEDEEDWADTNSEFIEENEDDEAVYGGNVRARKQHIVEFVDDNSSVMSCHTKDTADMAMVVWRSKKSLTGIVKDLDDYFLKASAVVKDVAIFIDIDAGGTFLYESVKENKRKRSNSAKVFSALTWSWSSKSLQSNRDIGHLSESGEPCKPGAHCITLQRLYSAEQKLYKDVKEEEIAKVEYGRKSLLLQRQEEEHDLAKAEKTRSTVESLQSYISSLQESIGKSYSTILNLISKELQPQLITLASGQIHMWQTMHHCHQLQNHISQQLNHITDQQSVEPTTEYHRQAAAQLQTEVTSWYHSFCNLVKFQREYVRALWNWTELTNCLEDINSLQGGNSSTVHALTGKWLQALDILPDKMVSEAIKSLLSAVHSIVLQQQDECNMHKRSDKLGKKLERELSLLSEVEMKFAGSFSVEDANSVLTSKHPLIIRRAKVEALKRLVEYEKAKYVNSVKTTRVMILNNLQTSLPKVFQALMVYSSAYAHSFEAILGNATVS